MLIAPVLALSLTALSLPAVSPIPAEGRCSKYACTVVDGRTALSGPSGRSRPANNAKRSGATAPSACQPVPSARQPPRTDPIWQGRSSGSIVTLSCALDGVNGSRVVVRQWVRGPAEAARMDPAALAQQVLTRLDLQPIRIGMVPGDGPDSMGAVGVPVWMWVDRPGPRTFGPISGSDTAAGLTVTITARVTSVDWDMGDGTIVRCSGTAARGTVHTDAADLSPSPDLEDVPSSVELRDILQDAPHANSDL